MTPGEGAAKFEHIFPPFGVGDPSHLYLCLDVGPHVLTWQIVEISIMRRKPKPCNSLGYSYTSQPAGNGVSSLVTLKGEKHC